MEKGIGTLELHSINHVDHGDNWLVIITESDIACLACLVELLEDGELLQVKKKMVLSQLVQMLIKKSERMSELFAADLRITAHVAMMLLDMLSSSDESFTCMAIEAEVQLLHLIQSEEIVNCVITSLAHESLKVCNYKKNVPAFNLVGRLLHSIPTLSTHLAQYQGSFIDYICAGLEYTDVSVQTSLLYVFMHLYQEEGKCFLSSELTRQVAAAVLNVLSIAQDQGLLMNALGVLKTMLDDNSLVEVYFQFVGEGPSFATSVKKVLLSRQEALQISSVQCIASVLNKPQVLQYADQLLQADVAEFMFEALSTTNELLMGSIFCSLILFTKSDAFFKKCHAVYGIEAILRSMEQSHRMKNPHIILEGMKLLSCILQRHKGGIQLFSNLGLIKQCLALIQEGIEHHKHHIVDNASDCLLHILKKEYLPSPVPFSNIGDAIWCVAKKAKGFYSVTPQLQKQRHGASVSERHASEQHSSRAHSTIHRLLLIIAESFRLTKACENDPCADENAFSSTCDEQDKTRSSLHGFCTLLFRVTDEICIPFIMIQSHRLQDQDVYSKLFYIMECIFTDYSTVAVYFAQKLVSAGFVDYMLDLQSRFGSYIQSSSASVLYHVIVCLMEASDGEVSDSLKNRLKQGLGDISGSLHLQLMQQSEGIGYHESAAVQDAVICLLYFCYKQGHRLIPPAILLEALEAYVCSVLPSCTQEHLPNPLMKYLLYLYAITAIECGKPCHTPSVQNLLEAISRCERLDDWCLAHPAFIRWSFSDERLAFLIGHQVVQFWLKSDPECTDVDKSKFLEDLARQNICLAKVLLNFLNSANEEELLLLSSILRNLLFNRQKESQNVDGLNQMIMTDLPEMLQKQLMVPDSRLPVGNLICMIELMCLLKREQYNTPLTTVDLKLAYHISKAINSEVFTDDRLAETGIHFLNALLIQSLSGSDNRACSMLLSDQHLLDYTQRRISDDLNESVLFFVTQLLLQQNKFSVQVHQGVDMDQNSMLGCLIAKPNNRIYCIMFFWAVFFLCKEDQRLVELTSCEKKSLIRDEDIGLPLSSKAIRKLYIYIQQCFLKENSLLQSISLCCTASLLDSLAKHKLIYEHLLKQAWNLPLLEVTFSQYTTGQILPEWVIQLSYIILRHDAHLLNQPKLQTLLLAYNHRDDYSPHTQKLLSGAASLISQMKLLDLDPETAESLKLDLKSCKVSKTTVEMDIVELLPVIQDVVLNVE